jgi:hypothetical protein
MKIKFEEIYNHIETIICTADTPYYDSDFEGTKIFLGEGGSNFIVTDADKEKVSVLVDNISENYKQHCVAALKRISLSFMEPDFIFKVDEQNGRVLINDKGTLQQYDDIYQFNWFYGSS